MTRTNYIKAFSFDVYHTYFQNNVCTCLRFRPTFDRLQMEKRGFQLRTRINGFDLFYSGTQPLADVLNYLQRVTGTDHFGFVIDTVDELFTQYTELSPDWLGEIEFTSNNALNTQNGNTVTLAPKLISNSVAQHTGTLAIYFADILAQNGNAPAYEVRFDARATQWQYYIINRSALTLNNLSITSKEGIRFEGPTNVKIQSGQEALLFSSGTQLVPLSFTPQQRFDLVSSTGTGEDAALKRNGGKVLVKGLPSADPANVGIVSVDGQAKVSSPIYVYI